MTPTPRETLGGHVARTRFTAGHLEPLCGALRAALGRLLGPQRLDWDDWTAEGTIDVDWANPKLGETTPAIWSEPKHGFGTGNDPSNLGRLRNMDSARETTPAIWGEPCWAILGPYWGHLGTILALLGNLRVSLGNLGAMSG
jgi:hypothetical protein